MIIWIEYENQTDNVSYKHMISIILVKCDENKNQTYEDVYFYSILTFIKKGTQS